ncbi:MAG: DNA-binding protein, partial [Sphingobacteriia bacterium]|nr:DNA-binding protein [Sphingobacteriia bacterium]
YSAELKKIEYQRSLVSPFDWLPADEVIKLLNISRRTFFNWRDNGILRVSSVRGKFYCKRSDMEKLLADHYKKGATDNC